MVSIAMPVAAALDILLPLAIAFVLSGGIFDDHSSPLSDTTIFSSAGSSCDHIDHVRTQLPYALSAGTAGIVAFFVAGLTDSAWIGVLSGVATLLAVVLVLVLGTETESVHADRFSQLSSRWRPASHDGAGRKFRA